MTSNKRDVTLVIRAKDEAKKAVDSVTKALAEVTKASQSLQQHSKGTSSVLQALGAEIDALSRKVSGVSVFDRIANSSKDAQSSVDRLKDRVQGLKVEQEKLNDSLTKAQEAERRAADEAQSLAAAYELQKEQTREAIAAQKELTKERDRSARVVDKYTQALQDAEQKVAVHTDVVAAGDDSAKRARDLQRASQLVEENKTKLAEATQQWARWEAQVATGSSAQQAAEQSLRQTKEQLQAMTQEARSAAKDTAQLAQSLRVNGQQIANTDASLARAKEALEGVQDATKQAQDAIDKMAGVLRIQLLRALAESKKELDLFQQAHVDITNLIRDMRLRGAAKTDPEMVSAINAARQAKEVYQQQRQEVSSLRAELRGAGTDLQALNSVQKRHSDSQQQITKAASDAVAAIAGIKNVSSAASAAVDSMAQSLRKNLLTVLKDSIDKLAEYKQAHLDITEVIRAMHAQGVEKTDPQMVAAIGAAQRAKEVFKQQEIAVAQLRAELKRAGLDVQALNAAQQNQQTRQSQINLLTAAAAQAQKSFQQAVRATTNALTAHNAAAGQGSSVLALFRRSGRRTLSMMERMRGQVIALAMSYVGLYAAINGVKGVNKAYLDMEAAQNRLGAVFKQDKKLVDQEINWLMAQADRLGIAFSTLSDEYGKFAVAADIQGFTGAQIRKTFLSVAEAARVNKLSMDQMSGVFLALQQMISKGKVMSEELRRQLGDRLPGAVNIMAQALGKGTAEMEKMLQRGEILADSDTMLKFANQLDERFGSQLPESLNSLSVAWGRFHNEVFRTQLAAGQSGLMDSIRDLLERLTDFMQSADGIQMFKTLGAAAGRVVKVLASLVAAWRLLARVVSLFIGFKVSALLYAIAEDFKKLKTGVANARVKFAAFNNTLLTTKARVKGLMAAFGALFPILVQVVMFFATQWFLGASDATEASSTLERHLRSLREAFEGAGEGAFYSAKGLAAFRKEALSRMTLTEAEQNVEDFIKSITKKLDRAKRGIESEWNTIRMSVAHLPPEMAAKRLAEPDKKAYGDVIKEFAALKADLKRTGEIDVSNLLNLLDRLAKVSRSAKREARASLDVLNRKDEGVHPLIAQLDQAQNVLVTLTASADEAAVAMEKLGNIIGDVSNRRLTAFEMLDLAQQKWHEAQPVDTAAQKLAESVFGLEQIIKQLEGISADDLLPTAEREESRLEEYYDLLGKVQERIHSLRTEAAQGLVDERFTNQMAHAARIGIAGGDAGSLTRLVESSWLDLFKRYFPTEAANKTRHQIIELRKESALYRQLIADYAKDNAEILTRAGVNVDKAALYLSHILGADGFMRLLSVDPSSLITDIFTPEELGSNKKSLLGKTVEDLREYAEAVVSLTDSAVKGAGLIQDLEDERTAEQRKYLQGLEKGIKDKLFEVDLIKMQKEGLGEQAAILKEVRTEEARAAAVGLKLSEAQIKMLSDAAAAYYQVNNAGKDVKDTEIELHQKRLDHLTEMHRELQESHDLAEKFGLDSKALILDAQIEGNKESIRELIDLMIEYWRVVNGAESELEILKLQNLKESFRDVREEVAITKTEMIDLVGEELLRGFESLADITAKWVLNLASAKDVILGVRDTFLRFASDVLRQVGLIIAQRAILLKLESSGWITEGALFPSFHGGGIAGNTTPNLSVSPAIWAAGAMKYHTGGIVGLAPNEVPAILKRGEEVLTERDPRHRYNGGGAASTNVKVVNAIDAGSFISEGLASSEGGKAIMNYIRANKSSIQRVLG